MKTRQSAELEERFVEFGLNVIDLVNANPMIPRPVVTQAIRAATSIGANYAEAQNASSRADFRNKIIIAKKEAAETRYWLRIIERLLSTQVVMPYLQEVQEILMILQKIVNTLHAKSAK